MHIHKCMTESTYAKRQTQMLHHVKNASRQVCFWSALYKSIYNEKYPK